MPLMPISTATATATATAASFYKFTTSTANSSCSSHQPPPGAAGDNSILNDPAAALASQFARSGFEQSNQYLQENFGSLQGDIKYYFKLAIPMYLRKSF